MTKSEAISLLGGTVADAAKAVGCTSAAISQWPEELPSRLSDRVQAALYRRLYVADKEQSDASAIAAATEGAR